MLVVALNSESKSSENEITEEALNLSVLKEIDSDSTLEELNKALYSLASSKAPEKDRILAEVLKSCKRNIIS